MYVLKPMTLLRAGGAAIGVGVVTGIAWGLLSGIGFVGFFIFFLAIGLGYVMSRAVDRASNRKRGYAIQVIAALGVVLAYLVRNALFAGALIITTDVWGLLAVVLAIFVAVSPLR